MESYRTQGTCSRQILFSVNDQDILTDVKFLGGCASALQAIARFAIGQHIDRVIMLCRGIRCQNGTSCPDQLACALCQYKERCLQLANEDPNAVKRGHPSVLKVY